MAGCFEPCGAVKEIEQWMEPGVKCSPAWSASGAVSYLRLGRRGGAGAAGGRGQGRARTPAMRGSAADSHCPLETVMLEE